MLYLHSSVIYFFCAVILDITFSWRTKRTMRFSQKLRFAVKLSIAVAWAIILPIFYASSQNYLSCSARRPKTFLGIFCLSKYMVVVALYLTSNVIGMALFFVPAVSSLLETSTWRICNMLAWWCQVCLAQLKVEYMLTFYLACCIWYWTLFHAIINPVEYIAIHVKNQFSGIHCHEIYFPTQNQSLGVQYLFLSFYRAST